MNGPGRPAMPAALRNVADLWPAGSVHLTRSGRGRSLLVLPSLQEPRMLVPSRTRRAGGMLRKPGRSLAAKTAQEALVAAQRGGLLRHAPLWRLALPDSPTALGIEALIESHVPGAASFGVLLGPPRPNSKPVLQVFDERGRTVAFGKVGRTPLTRRLVTHEAAVLADLERSPLRRITAPRVLFGGTIQDTAVLLMTALAAPRRRRAGFGEVPLGPSIELAESAGTADPVAVLESPYFDDLRTRLDALPLQAPARFAEHLDRARSWLVGVRLRTGRWHGDWAEWNMSGSCEQLQVWDWERSTVGVPLGYDVIHYLYQDVLDRESEASKAHADVLPGIRAILRRWYTDPADVLATVVLYELEIASRYVADSAGRPTGQVARRIALLDSLLSLHLASERPLRVD